MKRTFLLILIALFSAQIFGQTTEYSVQLTSGFFSFRGSDAGSSTWYNGYTNHTGYTNNPYGRESGFSYGITFQAQRVTKWHFIYGLQAGYESLSSKIKIDYVWTTENVPANNSKTILTNRFFNFHPFLGARMHIIHGIKTDLTVGSDFGFCSSSEEKATVHTSQGNYDTKLKRVKPKVDSRLRVDFINYYKHIGLLIGYSYGLTNYEAGAIGAEPMPYSPKVYSQMIRLGLVIKF